MISMSYTYEFVRFIKCIVDLKNLSSIVDFPNDFNELYCTYGIARFVKCVVDLKGEGESGEKKRWVYNLKAWKVDPKW